MIAQMWRGERPVKGSTGGPDIGRKIEDGDNDDTE